MTDINKYSHVDCVCFDNGTVNLLAQLSRENARQAKLIEEWRPYRYAAAVKASLKENDDAN